MSPENTVLGHDTSDPALELNSVGRAAGPAGTRSLVRMAAGAHR